MTSQQRPPDRPDRPTGWTGADPAYSALNLRLAFSVFGLLAGAAATAGCAYARNELPNGWAWVAGCATFTVLVAVNIVVIEYRRRQRIRAETEAYGEKTSHGLFG